MNMLGLVNAKCYKVINKIFTFKIKGEERETPLLVVLDQHLG